MSRLWLPLITLASALVAQPKFDVVSIRPTARPNMANEPPFRPGGHFVDSAPLEWLIPMAYEIPLPDRQLIGMPKWAGGKVYAIEAKAGADFPTLPPAENQAQIRLMLREMLADRFKLRLHVETRQEAVLMMTAEKGSLKIKEVAAAVPPEKSSESSAMGDRGGSFTANKITMARLATLVSLYLKQEVVDQTGLTGHYDFALRWTAPKVEGMPPPAPTLGPDGIALFLSTLREELGLRFNKGTGPVLYWVIDSLEPPTEN